MGCLFNWHCFVIDCGCIHFRLGWITQKENQTNLCARQLTINYAQRRDCQCLVTLSKFWDPAGRLNLGISKFATQIGYIKYMY